jgi:hypothetical protein
MKNKLFLAGIVGMLLVFGVMVTSCDNVTQVEGTVFTKTPKTDGVSSVTATKTTDGNSIIVTWSAVENVSSYELRVKQEGKQTAAWAGSSNNSYKYGANGDPTANDDVDAWSARIDFTDSSYVIAKSYVFGVRAYNIDGEVSDIVWSTPVQR